MRHDIQFYVLFILIAPYWAVRSVIDMVQQRKKDKAFTWDKYWEGRQ